MTEASWEHRGTATGPLPPQGSEPQQDARKAEAGSPGLVYLACYINRS